ncbi:hypothetical protein ACFVQ4_04130 [Streptomyces laurentii]
MSPWEPPRELTCDGLRAAEAKGGRRPAVAAQHKARREYENRVGELPP